MEWSIPWIGLTMLGLSVLLLRFCGRLGHRALSQSREEPVKGGYAKHDHHWLPTTLYCPLHPEITSANPRAWCPKCEGMALRARPTGKAMA
jgi:hypothetical protein